jgi:hypothetical protein
MLSGSVQHSGGARRGGELRPLVRNGVRDYFVVNVQVPLVVDPAALFATTRQ